MLCWIQWELKSVDSFRQTNIHCCLSSSSDFHKALMPACCANRAMRTLCAASVYQNKLTVNSTRPWGLARDDLAGPEVPVSKSKSILNLPAQSILTTLCLMIGAHTQMQWTSDQHHTLDRNTVFKLKYSRMTVVKTLRPMTGRLYNWTEHSTQETHDSCVCYQLWVPLYLYVVVFIEILFKPILCGCWHCL